MYTYNGTEEIEYHLMDLRFNLANRTASGTSVHVGIDSKSIRDLKKWPWKRQLHADLIRQLTIAGAAQIVLDIDLSSSSSTADDDDLTAAIKEASGRVILPVFKQRTKNSEEILAYTKPLPVFSEYAQMASVNIQAEEDSLVRRYNRVEMWQGSSVPAMATQLVGVLPDSLEPFYVDFSIQPESVPYFSYVDVLHGKFPPEAIKGKTVFVGAAAVELGDMFAVPVYRALSGSMVQILAYESIKLGRAIERTAPGLSVLIILLISLLLGPRISAWSWQRGFLTTIGAGGMIYAAAAMLQYIAPISADISPLLLVLFLLYIWSLIEQIDIQSLGIFKQRMAAVHSRALMKSVVEESFDGIIITNQDGEIQFANPAACKLLKRETNDITKENINSFLHTSGIGRKKLHELSLNDSNSQVLVKSKRAEIATKNGIKVPVEYSATRVPLVSGQSPMEARSENRSSYIYTLHDIRESQKAAALLREAHDNLEEKVKERTTQLEQARDEAEDANRLKSQLLTTMSHELRTPLTSIIGSLRLVKEGVIGNIEGDALDLIDIAWKNGSQLAKLVNDIIDTERFEAQAQKLNLGRVDLTELVNHSITLNTGYASEYQVKIIGTYIESDAYVHGDKDRLLQVMANLTSNAVKFSTVGGSVLVVLERKATGFRIGVTNAGEAIPVEIRDTIFNKFVRGNNTDNRNVGGAGLGLAITKAIIEEHKGQIDFTSNDETGTTFFFDLPEYKTTNSVF